MTALPPRPELAPEDGDDRDLAAERMRFGAAIVVLEGMVTDLARWAAGK